MYSHIRKGGVVMTNKIKLDIDILKMTIHELDLVKDQGKFAEDVFPVNNLSEKVEEFFVDHISEARTGKSTKSCHFTAEDTWLRGEVNNYRENMTNESFLSFSQSITNKLFTTMKTSSSRSSGSFFVIKALIEGEEFIALIKLDPKTRVQFEPTTLTLSLQENILPDPKEKIHKCALIRLNNDGDQHVHLYVLDKQQNQGEVSKFFMKSFLESEEIINDEILTKEAMKKVKANFLPIIPEDKKYHFIDAVEREFSDGRAVDLHTSLPKILEQFDFEDAFIEESSNNFINDFVGSNPDYQSSFKVIRTEVSMKFQTQNNEIFFRYNKSIRDAVDMFKDSEGNTIIKIDKKYELDLK